MISIRSSVKKLSITTRLFSGYKDVGLLFVHLIDKSFTKSPKSYIFQSLLAVIAVLIILTFVEVLTHAVIVAALGSSAFVIFAMPGHPDLSEMKALKVEKTKT